MNVYSVRLLPTIKLKFCELFGIASTLAVEQLQDRVDRIELKLNRLDGQIKRARRRAAPTPQPILVKANRKPKTPKLASSDTPKLADIVLEATPGLRAVEEKSEEVVILIQPDEETRGIAQSFFSNAKILETDSVEDLEEVETRELVSILFDRTLLGDEKSREILEKVSQNSPKTKLIGISSYLTLAFAESLPRQKDDFATLLTRPLSHEALGTVFDGKKERAIS